MASNDDAGSTGRPADPIFIPSLALSSAFYTEIVAPILADAYPRLRYSAALIGYGSEVLGYDTARSTDHEWGPRLPLFVSDDDYAQHAEAHTDASWAAAAAEPFGASPRTLGLQAPTACSNPRPPPSGPIVHKIHVYPLRGLLTHLLGV